MNDGKLGISNLVVFAKLHPGTEEFAFNEMMAVEVVGDEKRQERADA
jgi:hypothetical protein